MDILDFTFGCFPLARLQFCWLHWYQYSDSDECVLINHNKRQVGGFWRFLHNGHQWRVKKHSVDQTLRHGMNILAGDLVQLVYILNALNDDFQPQCIWSIYLKHDKALIS